MNTLQTPLLVDLVDPVDQEHPAHEIRLISWNVQKGRHTEQACRWIAAQRPDIVAWQELQPGDLKKVQGLLRLHGYPAVKLHGSTNDNSIFVHDDGLFMVEEEYEHGWAPWHAPANIEVRLRGAGEDVSQRKLSVVSTHDCYWSSTVRLQEAEWATTLAKPGYLCIRTGDGNGFPTDAPDIDWSKVEDKAFMVNRTYLAEDGTRRTDDRADRILTAAGFIDAARYVADKFGRREALRPTAGYGKDKAQQAGPQRIDRTIVSAELTPAIKDFIIGDPDPETDALLQSWSDHLPQQLVLHGDVVDQIMQTSRLAAGL
ncbi:hypothetical protein [Streptomyces sp. MNP-20]|uniref:endonuclease/exonuclease/phosphatase family protein n=1 Tax=Streptomyces sp. MNP-20 TaxID=2721165 RepID=UPI00155405F6|nr:hypothetical protein [Streptomyces sp. MNP-20]